MQEHFLGGRHDRIQCAPGSEGGAAREFLAEPAGEFCFPRGGGAGGETLLPGEIYQPGLKHHLRHLFGGLMQEPKNFRGRQVVFGPPLAQEPLYELLLARRQESVRKAALNLGGAKVELEHTLPRITPKSGGNVLDGPPRETELYGGRCAEPLAVATVFSFRHRGRKAPPQPSIISQHPRRESRRPVDGTLRVRRGPDVQIRPGLIPGENQRPAAIDVETIIRCLRATVAGAEK